MMLFRRALTSVLVLAVSTACTPDAVVSPTSPIIEPRNERQGEVPSMLVMLRPSENAATVAREHGIAPNKTFSGVIKGFLATIPEAALAGLASDHRVLKVESDAPVTTAGVQYPAPWGLDRSNQRLLPLDSTYTYEATGAGVTVYITDTGIRYSHSEFNGRASFGYDVFGGDGSDCNNHGSHVAGIVGGAIYGVAKAVSLVSVRVLDCTGSGTVSGVISGLEWISANHAPLSAVNLSLQTPFSDILNAAVNNLVASGVPVVVAAGNSASDACGYSPASALSAITVGATDALDRKASFSNWGTCLDIFGPGNGITSAASSSDIATVTLSGTSQASPHVAGAVAILMSQNPALTPYQLDSTIEARSTHGIVANASSTKANLLYTGADVDTTVYTPYEPVPPAAPSNLAYTILGFNKNKTQAQIRFTWTDNATDETSYVLTGFRNGAATNVTMGQNSTTTDVTWAAGQYSVQVSASKTENGVQLTGFSPQITVLACPNTKQCK